MRYLWSLNIDDYMEIVKRAKANGKKAGDSMEEELMQYMKEKDKKPIGATELNMDEMLKEQAYKGLSVLGIETSKDGKTKYKIIKKKKEE